MTLSEKETAPQNPYNFILDNDSTWYSFVTKNDIRYEVAFLKSPALFCEYPSIAGLIYEITIETVFDSPPYDYCVQLTVIGIVKQFLDSNRSALLFICDNMDGKHTQRQIKFDRWIDNAGLGDNYEKHDGVLDIEEYQIFNTLIIKVDFELKKQILEAFFEINND